MVGHLVITRIDNLIVLIVQLLIVFRSFIILSAVSFDKLELIGRVNGILLVMNSQNDIVISFRVKKFGNLRSKPKFLKNRTTKMRRLKRSSIKMQSKSPRPSLPSTT